MTIGEDIMLSKISRATAAAPSTTPLSRRSVSTSNTSLHELRQGLRQARTSSNPIPVLQQIRESPLFREVLDMVNAAGRSVQSHQHAHLDEHARIAATGHALCYAVGAVTDMADHYELRLTTRAKQQNSSIVDAHANDRIFMAQIKKPHAHYLKLAFQSTWNANSPERQAAILSAITPEAAEYFELISSAEHKELAKAWGSIPPERLLSLPEMLALLDYVNSQSGTFNAINGSAIASANYGEQLFSSVTEVFSAALISAIIKLSHHPYFERVNIEAFKGVNLSDRSGIFRKAALEAALGTGKLIVFPQVLSATSDPVHSYAVAKHHLGYTLECRLVMARGFDADPFHDVETMGEMEVLGPPGQKFIVTEKRAVETPHPERGGMSIIDQYVLKPAQGAHGS